MQQDGRGNCQIVMKPEEILILCSIIMILTCSAFGWMYYSLQQKCKKNEKYTNQLKRERDAYLTLLTDHSEDYMPVLIVDGIFDLPNVGVQGIVYQFQGTDESYMWDNVEHTYIRLEEWPSIEIRAQQQLERAQTRVEHWNRQYTTGEQLFDIMPVHDNAWQHIVTTYNRPTEYPQIRIEELDVDERIKNTAPPVRKPKNRLKNIFGGNHV